MTRSIQAHGVAYAVAICLGIAAAVSAPTFAWAQKYPEQPVRLIAPYTAGGVLDSISRLLADKFTTMWKQPVTVDNRTGGGGMILSLIHI